MKTVVRSSSRARSSIASSGSRPSRRRSRRCCAARARVRPARYLDDVDLVPFAVEAGETSSAPPARRAHRSRNAGRRAPRSAPRRLSPSAGFQLARPFDRIGRREREIHRQRAARHLAEQRDGRARWRR